MTTTTDTAPAEAEREAAENAAYADTLAVLVEQIRAGAIPRPTSRLRLYMTSWSLYRDNGAGKAAFLAARRAFPDATVSIENKDYVELQVGEHAVLLFDKTLLGEQTTVTRPVVEYVIDPDLLAAPVSA